jgi:hypothetical protein
MNLEFYQYIFEKYSYFMEIRSAIARFFYADVRADKTKLISRLCAVLRMRLKTVPDCWVQDDMVVLRRV